MPTPMIVALRRPSESAPREPPISFEAIYMNEMKRLQSEKNKQSGTA
jgi:hypothetical protein